MATPRSVFLGLPQGDEARVIATAEQKVDEMMTGDLAAVLEDAMDPNTPTPSAGDLGRQVAVAAQDAAAQTASQALEETSQPQGFISLQSVTNFTLMVPVVNVVYRFLETLDFSGGRRLLEGN